MEAPWASHSPLARSAERQIVQAFFPAPDSVSRARFAIESVRPDRQTESVGPDPTAVNRTDSQIRGETHAPIGRDSDPTRPAHCDATA